MAANPVAPVPELSLDVVRNGDEVLVHCHGRIVSATTNTLQDRVRGVIPGSTRIVLDLTDVSYLDSSGLGTLVGLYVSAKRGGSSLKLIHLSDRVKELLRLTQLAGIFEGHNEYLGMTPD
jgi:anti-sigma B factor antagonist